MPNEVTPGEAYAAQLEMHRDAARVMTDARKAALWVIGFVGEPWVVQIAVDLYNQGKGRWQWDPEVPGVVGLVKTGTTNDAWLVVYVHDMDFESSDDFDRLVPGTML